MVSCPRRGVWESGIWNQPTPAIILLNINRSLRRTSQTPKLNNSSVPSMAGVTDISSRTQETIASLFDSRWRLLCREAPIFRIRAWVFLGLMRRRISCLIQEVCFSPTPLFGPCYVNTQSWESTLVYFNQWRRLENQVGWRNLEILPISQHWISKTRYMMPHHALSGWNPIRVLKCWFSFWSVEIGKIPWQLA